MEDLDVADCVCMLHSAWLSQKLKVTKQHLHGSICENDAVCSFVCNFRDGQYQSEGYFELGFVVGEVFETGSDSDGQLWSSRGGKQGV